MKVFWEMTVIWSIDLLILSGLVENDSRIWGDSQFLRGLGLSMVSWRRKMSIPVRNLSRIISLHNLMGSVHHLDLIKISKLFRFISWTILHSIEGKAHLQLGNSRYPVNPVDSAIEKSFEIFISNLENIINPPKQVKHRNSVKTWEPSLTFKSFWTYFQHLQSPFN